MFSSDDYKKMGAPKLQVNLSCNLIQASRVSSFRFVRSALWDI